MTTLIIFLKIFQIVLLLAMVFIMLGIMFVMLSFRNIVPFVPTPRKMARLVAEYANVKPGERIIDLGSGTGRLTFAAAKMYKQNIVVGVEKSFILRKLSRLFLFLLHPALSRRVQFIKADFFNLDLHNYDVIITWVTPEALRILTPRFQALKSGSRVITYMFSLDDYSGFSETIANVTSKNSIFIYKKL